MADRSRYPKFIRQGVGTDPYAGVNLRWPNIDVIQDGHLGNRLVQTDNMDFAPRVGIAWTPTSKWVVRTGAGVFYNQDTGNPRFDMSRNLAGRVRFNPAEPGLSEPDLAERAGQLHQFGRPGAHALRLRQQV